MVRRALCACLLAMTGALAAPRYRSPGDVAFSPDGTSLAVADRTAGCLVLLTASDGSARREVPLVKPGAVVWTDQHLLVSESGGLSVADIDPATARVVRRYNVGARPHGLAPTPDGTRLVVANTASEDLSIVEFAGGTERRVPLGGEPFAVAVTPDSATALVTLLRPRRPSTDPECAAEVLLVDLAAARVTAAIDLPVGATAVREVAVDAAGRFAYVAHVVGRFHLPPTQPDRGWINTNAVTILDPRAGARYATLLLDRMYEGAADPWGVALSPDGAALCVTLSGAGELARLDLTTLHAYLEGRIPADSPLLAPSPELSLTALSPWPKIVADPAQRTLLADDLTALTAAGLLERRPLPGAGPRGIDIADDGRIAVAEYFAGDVAIVGGPTLPVAPQPPADAARLGEQAFHDGKLGFQAWLSCATCHPDGRADGLNWDLLNDGIGNPKNTKSLLWSDRTPPAMAHGVRATMEVASQAGFRFILFREPQATELDAVIAYLRSMTPLASPHRSAAADRGRRLFADPKVACAECHPAPLYTDLKSHDVGTRAATDTEAEFDTPTLVECWRTAPYLHDGRAMTIAELLTTANAGDKHGVTSHLTPAQVRDLAAFVQSL